MKNNQRQIKYHNTRGIVTTFFLLVVIGFVSVFSYIQILLYEESVIDIYATQQDAYVQLVLDQINLVEDRTSLEIVSDILATLDSSSNRYWTLSENQSLVFVKDILETNRYKGFTAETYYESEEARIFISDLNVNQVIHRLIQLENKEYTASGASFTYNNESYQICLLTNSDTILENNVYMSAKINLCIAIAVIIITYIVVVFGLMLKNEKLEKKYNDVENNKKELRITIEKMNNKLQRERLFDTSYSVFDSSIFDMLMEKVKARNILPVTTAVLTYANEEAKNVFFENAQFMLDEKVIRFQNKSEKKIILVALKCSSQALKDALKPLLKNGIFLQQMVTDLDNKK